MLRATAHLIHELVPLDCKLDIYASAIVAPYSATPLCFQAATIIGPYGGSTRCHVTRIANEGEQELEKHQGRMLHLRAALGVFVSAT